MIKPKMLVLFCCAGGESGPRDCSTGYSKYFTCTGVDIKPQPNYQHTFIQADAFEYLEKHWREYDLIHASPPCQRYSEITPLRTYDSFPDYIGPIREALQSTGKPYVIENVRLARHLLINPQMLCGHQFGLRTYRHRFFEIDPFILVPPHIKHPEPCPASGRGRSKTYGFISVTGNGGAPNLNMPYLEYAQMAMGMDWANRAEISEAIPPIFAEYIGGQLMNYFQ